MGAGRAATRWCTAKYAGTELQGTGEQEYVLLKVLTLLAASPRAFFTAREILSGAFPLVTIAPR